VFASKISSLVGLPEGIGGQGQIMNIDLRGSGQTDGTAPMPNY